MSSSKSSSATQANTQNTTYNQDQRLNVASGAVGATASSGGVVNITNTDSGAFEMVRQSYDTLAREQGDGLDKLLDGFGKLIDAGQYVIETNTALTKDVLNKNSKLSETAMLSYAPTMSAKTEQDSKKTILIAAGIGAAVLLLRK